MNRHWPANLPTGRAGSLFQHIFSGPGGIDPYAFVVSDVYQDLFGEGSYSGKGIYDVNVFEAALRGRFPDNTVLSHDLLEGIFAGSGLVSDVEVVEEYPERYDVAAARQHRWVRGDWQLLPWLLALGRDSSGEPGRRTIPLIGRWKMMDNLRRSLSAPATFCALLGGWTLPFAVAVVWTGFELATIALPPLLPFFAGLIPRRRQISKRSHVRALSKDLTLAVSQIIFHVSVLPHQAWLMADAITRTLFRLFVSHRHMLEWITAAQAKFGLPLIKRTSASPRTTIRRTQSRWWRIEHLPPILDYTCSRQSQRMILAGSASTAPRQNGCNAFGNERARALSRPLLQLVRYTGPSSAGPEVHFHCGQRQPRGPSERAVNLAWTQAQVQLQLHRLGIGAEEAHLFQHLAGHI